MTDDGHGEFGYLTWGQWQAFQWAVNESAFLAYWLHIAGAYSISDPDEARGGKSADVPLGLPATKLAAIEIDRLRAELRKAFDDMGSLEAIANDVEGAELATMFTREVQTARARWPYEDEPHEVKYIDCMLCRRPTLKFAPPSQGGVDSTVECTFCGTTETGEHFTDRVEAFAREYEEIKRAS